MSDVDNLDRFFEAEVKRLRIDVRLNTEASVESIRALGPRG